MHTPEPTTAAAIRYRERLTPSFWILGAALLLAPMAALVFVRIEPTLALIAGIAVGVLVVAVLLLASPVVEVSGGELKVGRAHIDVHLLDAPTAAVNDEARAARGMNLDARAWHRLRGGIDGVLTVPVNDPADPTSAWVVSSRTPDRLAAAIVAAQQA